MADASTFSVTTISGSERMTIQLRGRALPYQGLAFEGAMRAEFTRYPGNPVATVQMLGAEEKQTTINGMWKDRFIKSFTDDGVSVQPEGIGLVNQQQVEDSYALVLAFDRLRLLGQLLRVEWDGHVREGVLLNFKHRWTRREDVEWEITFEWISRGETQTPVTLPVSATPETFAQQTRSLVDRLQAALTPPRFPVVEEFTRVMNESAAAIDDATVVMENAVRKTAAAVLAPAEAAERVMAAAETVASSASTIVATVEAFPALLVVKASSAQRRAMSLGEALAAFLYTLDIKAAAKELQHTASDQAQTLSVDVRQEALLASFIARAPMDLRDVSQQFYGTPDEWRSLLIYNDLDSSMLLPGDVVLVPKLATAERRV